ncbi:MAG: T9SS type A sorting domain-containing protein, partial [Cyclobacteriaceae bacterium]
TKGELIQNVKVYPNPVENTLKVDYANLTSDNIQLQLFNIEGRVVHQMMLPRADENTTLINVSEMGSGMYILNMVDLDDGSLVKSFKLLIRK